VTTKGKRQEQRERRVTFGSTLFTSALTVLAAVVIFFVINSFRPVSNQKEFSGLISPADGRIVLSRDPDLNIDGIYFDDFDKNERSVPLDDNPGYKLNLFVLREREGCREIDMLKTLSSDSIEISTLPEVPQEIEIQVTDGSGKGKIQLYVITDRPYPGGQIPAYKGTASTKDRFRVQVGRKGLTGFLKAEAGGFYTPGITSGVTGLGEGPVAAILAVRLQGNRAVGRSQLVILKRKGILHPDDIWFDEDRTGYFSLPFLGNNLDTSRLAFLTPVKEGKRKVVICTMDYKQHYDVSALFPEGPITIDHWGKTQEDYNILYVREEFGEGNLQKVRVGTLDVARFMENLASFPPQEAYEKGSTVGQEKQAEGAGKPGG